MIMQVPELKSGFVDFAAMSNNMNRNMAMRHITGIQDTPVTDSKFIKVCESTCQHLNGFGLNALQAIGFYLLSFLQPHYRAEKDPQVLEA